MTEFIGGIEQNEESKLIHSKSSNVGDSQNNIPWVEIGTLSMKGKLVSIERR